MILENLSIETKKKNPRGIPWWSSGWDSCVFQALV